MLNTKLLVKLLGMVPKEIFLTNAEFHLNSNNPTVELYGHADNSDSVFLFLSDLSKEKMFKKANLKSTNEVEIDEERYFIRFVISIDVNTDELYSDSEEKDKEDENESEDEDEGDEGGDEE